MPFAVVNYNLDIVSFSSPEPVDVFLTASDDGKITTWYTFPQRERLGVDANGTLELESEVIYQRFRTLPFIVTRSCFRISQPLLDF